VLFESYRLCIIEKAGSFFGDGQSAQLRNIRVVWREESFLPVKNRPVDVFEKLTPPNLPCGQANPHRFAQKWMSSVFEVIVIQKGHCKIGPGDFSDVKGTLDSRLIGKVVNQLFKLSR